MSSSQSICPEADGGLDWICHTPQAQVSAHFPQLMVLCVWGGLGGECSLAAGSTSVAVNGELPVHSACFVLSVEDMISRLLALATIMVPLWTLLSF